MTPIGTASPVVRQGLVAACETCRVYILGDPMEESPGRLLSILLLLSPCVLTASHPHSHLCEASVKGRVHASSYIRDPFTPGHREERLGPEVRFQPRCVKTLQVLSCDSTPRHWFPPCLFVQGLVSLGYYPVAS